METEEITESDIKEGLNVTIDETNTIKDIPIILNIVDSNEASTQTELINGFLEAVIIDAQKAVDILITLS